MFEFFFKYSPAVFDESRLVLASQWPHYALYLAFLAGAAAILYTLFRSRSRLAAWKLGILGALQLAMLAVVLVLLWQPALMNERLVPGENSVAVVLDTSASMNFIDNGRTRMAVARELVSAEGLASLARTYNILPYAFSDSAQRLDDFDALPLPDEATDIDQSLLAALRQSSGASLGAVVLISDGADNNGSLSQASLSEIISYGVPVHTVGLGRETVPEDLELTEVVLPDKALPGTTLSARVTIRHDRAGIARLKVYDGEEFLGTEEITLGPDDSSTLAYIDIEAAEPGQLDLRFTLDPVAGESNLANNERAQVMDVQESRYRILYIEGEPRWEYKFMQRALADDPSVQLTTLLRVTPNKFYRQGIDNPEELADGFPIEPAELKAYDALIIGSVEAAEFTPEQQQMVHDFVSERGGTLMMIAGLRSLGLGGWGDTVVNDILPARLNAGASTFVRAQVPVVLTDAGRASAMLRFDESDSENDRAWRELPDIADYQLIGPLRPAASTLVEVLVDGRPQPLLVTQPYGRGQSVILATGGTWRWQMSLPVEDMKHETFWRQLARSLVANSPRPFELSTRTEDQHIVVSAQLRDPADEANQGLEVSTLVTGDNDDLASFDLLPVPGKPGSFEGRFTPSSPGLFSVETISRIGDEPRESVRTATRFSPGNEAFNTRQNRPLLERLAAMTGGRYFTPAQWGEIDDAIAFSDAGITEQEISYLWDAPAFFLLLILLKAAEWLLRRRWRTI